LTPSPHVGPREAALVIFPGRCSGVRVVSTGLRQGHWPTGTSGVRAAVARPSGVMWTARGWRPGALSLLPAVRRQALETCIQPGSAAAAEAAAQAGPRNTERHRPALGPQTATSRDLKRSHFHKATGQSQPEPEGWAPGVHVQLNATGRLQIKMPHRKAAKEDLQVTSRDPESRASSRGIRDITAPTNGPDPSYSNARCTRMPSEPTSEEWNAQPT
jgi:hypothetical protein